jgi:hypothetical protein
MFLRDTQESSTFIRKYKSGKEVECKSVRTTHYFKCDKCGVEFSRPKNGYTNLHTGSHFCTECYSKSEMQTLSTLSRKREFEQNGEKVKIDRGYKEIYVGNEYPYRNTLWVREHIAVIERHIGKRIPDGFVVHHIDGNKANNKLSNLLLCSVANHNKCHGKIERLVFELYEKGLVDFDKEKMEYFLKQV